MSIKSIFLQILSFVLLIKTVKQYITLSFKTVDNTDKSLTIGNSSINNYPIYTNFYTEIEIGTPLQKVKTQITMLDYGFKLKEDSNLSQNYFNKRYSSSIIEKLDNEPNYRPPYLDLKITEKIFLPTVNIKSNSFYLSFTYSKKLSKEEQELYRKNHSRKQMLINSLFSLDEKQSYLNKYENNKAYCIIGMKLSSDSYYDSKENFITTLNNKNITNLKIWFIDFDQKKIFIGKYPDGYSINDLIYVNAIFYQHVQNWEIHFTDNFLKIHNTRMNIGFEINAQLYFDLNYIISSPEFLEMIKQNYFNNHINDCSEFISNDTDYVFYKCNKKFDTKNFPTIYFYHKIFNYTFELTYEDLFIEKNEEKLFLILFDKKCKNLWKFGQVFLKKYLFIFNIEDKAIGFYRQKINSKNNKNISINLIWGFLVIFAGVGGFILGRKIYYKIRKNRVNELDDNYAYYNHENGKQRIELVNKK